MPFTKQPKARNTEPLKRTVTFTISDELYDLIAEACEKYNRFSIADTIRIILWDYLVKRPELQKEFASRMLARAREVKKRKVARQKLQKDLVYVSNWKQRMDEKENLNANGTDSIDQC